MKLNIQKKQSLGIKKSLLSVVLASSLLIGHVYAADESSAGGDQTVAAQMSALDWHIGPKNENILSKATLDLAKDQGFLDQTNSTKFLKLTDNIPTDSSNILVAADNSWWAEFTFDPVGYVKDDEKIDANELLQQIKSSDEAGNEERKRLGVPLLHTEGWYIPPHYDSESKHLEWALKLSSEGQTIINYTVRLLGRTGVMSATLVSSPETLDHDVEQFKDALSKFNFVDGERYSQFKDGDKIAEYGLAALIAGGAAAVATKKGFWALLAGFFAATWKFIAIAGVAVASWFGSLFKKKS